MLLGSKRLPFAKCKFETFTNFVSRTLPFTKIMAPKRDQSRSRSRKPVAKKAQSLKIKSKTSLSKTAQVRVFYALFAVCIGVCAVFFSTAPALSTLDECIDDGEPLTLLWLVKNRDAKLKEAFKCASAYQKKHSDLLQIGYVLLYVSMQAFAIPGPIVLSVLAGALFPFWKAQAMIAVSATSGATACFLLSSVLGGGLLEFFKVNDSPKLKIFQDKVAEAGQGFGLWWYLVLSRVTPVPNIVINLCSPHMGVSVRLHSRAAPQTPNSNCLFTTPPQPIPTFLNARRPPAHLFPLHVGGPYPIKHRARADRRWLGQQRIGSEGALWASCWPWAPRLHS